VPVHLRGQQHRRDEHSGRGDQRNGDCELAGDAKWIDVSLARLDT
jgi:hypothetical protein